MWDDEACVVASGYFNPLHYGHVSYLEKARDLGTSLIVIVNNDGQAQRRSKKPQGGELTLPARERVKLVRSLQCVDAAVEAVDEDDSVAETLQLLHPDIFANGGGQIPTKQEVQVCQRLRIQMVDGLGIQLLSLAPFTQHYDWGKPRNESIIAALTGQQSPHLVDEPDARKPFAEMWMGDHPSGPARVVSPGTSPRNADKAVHRSTSLQEVFHKTPSVLGPQLQDAKQLPFLLKVLSIQKALSIQAHPDRELASRLHLERPHIYKDPNHKPEIAIALTDDFRALCGFRTVSEIVQILEYVPEASTIIGKDCHESLKAAIGDKEAESTALQNAYTRLMHASEKEITDQLELLQARAKPPADAPPNIQDLFELIGTLQMQYENDVGIFAAMFMNYARLKVGECLYMAQNVPHAYISGDIVECMACSDNVVRGGLTPKFKDVEVLCSMLRYEGGAPATVKPTELEAGIRLYADPDIEEFQVIHLHLEVGGRQHRLFSSEGPAMALNLKGHGTVTISGETRDIGPGKVFMLAAGVEPEIHAKTEMDVFVACCPPQYFKGAHFSPLHK